MIRVSDMGRNACARRPSTMLARITSWLLLLLACAALPLVAGALLDPSFASIPLLPSDRSIADAASAALSSPAAYTALSASNSFDSGAPYLSSAVLALETGSAGSGGLEIDEAALSVSSWQSGASRVVTGWTDTSGRGNHLRAASLASAPQARPFPALSGLPALMFRGSSLIREMSLLLASDLSTSSSIQGLPLAAAERTISMVVRFVSATGHDQCGIQNEGTQATGKEFIAAPGGFSYGSISASGVKSSFGVGSNLRNEFVASASGFSLSSLTWGAELSGAKDLSNTTIPTDNWGVLTTVVRADPLGVADTVEVHVYWNTALVATGKIAQVDTQLPFSSEAPAGGVDAATYAGNSLDEPAASFDPVSQQSWTSPYGIGALTGLSTASSSSNASSFTPGFIALGGSQNFSSCMDVAALIVYDAALSIAEQADLDNYLGAKWLGRQQPFDALPVASNPLLPSPNSIVLNLQADVGLVLSSAASLKSWRDQSARGNDLHVAFANYSAAALWSYPTSPSAPAAVGGSDNPNEMLLRPALPGSQSIRSLFGVGPAGGGVLIRRNALNGHPVLHMRAGKHVQELQQRMVGYMPGAALVSTVALASPASTFAASTAAPMHGGLLRGAPSPGQELRGFPTAVADRTLVTLMRFLPSSPVSAANTATTASHAACASGIYFGRNSRSDNDRTAGNTTAQGLFTDDTAQGMGIGFTSTLLPASTLLSPNVSDSPAAFPSSTSSADFFIHTLVWKAGVESSYLNGTLVGSRVLPLAAAFASLTSSDASFVVNSGLPVANLALAKRLNPAQSFSDFSSLDLNTGCGANVEVAAVLLYDRALMEPEHQIVVGYLALKYLNATEASGIGHTAASNPERVGGANALQTRIQAANVSIVSRMVPTRLELVGEGFGRAASDLTGSGVTFGPVSGREYVCDSALWSNSTALTCTISPSVIKASDLDLSIKFVAWINWKPSVASAALLSFAPATVAHSFQVRGTTAATKLPEGSFLKLEVRPMLSLSAAVNLLVSVSSSGSGAAAPRLPSVISPASGVVEFPLRAAWTPASIAEMSVYVGWCTVSGGAGSSCVLTVSFEISGPNPQALVAPSDVVVTVSGAPFPTAFTSGIYATAGDKYGCSNGATARDLDVTLADTARRMHFCSGLRVAALSDSWIEFDIWPQLSGIANTAMLDLTPSAILGGAGALSLTLSWTHTFDSVASSFAAKPAAYAATTQAISVNTAFSAQSFDIATVINAALSSVQAQASSPPLRVTIQLSYNSGAELQFDVDAVKLAITWMSSLSAGTFPQVLFPNQLSPPLTLTFQGRLPDDAQVSVHPSWGWMGSSSSVSMVPASSNSIVQRQGDSVSFRTFSSGLGVHTPASLDFSVSVKGAMSGLPVGDVASLSLPSIQLAPSALSFASVSQSSPGVLGSRQGFGLVVDPVSDKIFVIGGYDRDTGVLINSVFMSQDAASWTAMLAPSFEARESFCSLVFPPTAGATDSIIFIMGGLGSGGPLQDSWKTTDGGATWFSQAAPGWAPARSKMGCTVHTDGFAYLIAGQSAGGALSDVWRSPDGVTWSEVSVSAGAAFTARSGAALISVQGSLILMSCTGCSTIDISTDGMTWRQVARQGEMYSVAHGQRALIFAQPSHNIVSSADGEHWNGLGFVTIDYLTRPAIAVFQGRLLIVGTAAGKQTAAWMAHAQASATGSPIVLRGDLTRRASAASATDPVTSVSVVAGGNLGVDFLGDPLNDCWCTLDGLTWQQSTSLAPWSARAAAHLGFLTRTGLPSVLILVGGIGAVAPEPDVWRSVDAGPGVLLSSSWTRLADAPVQRYSAASTQLRGALLLISGAEYYDLSAYDVWSASCPDGATDVLWTQLTDNAPFPSRTGAVATVSNDKIVLAGGYSIDNAIYLTDVWTSADGAGWTEVLASAPWTARKHHGLVNLPNNVLLLFGGTDDSTQFQDCWASAGGAAHWQRSMQCGVPAQADFTTIAWPGVSAMILGGHMGIGSHDYVYTIQSMACWAYVFGNALPADRVQLVATVASPLASARAQANLLFDSTSNTLLLLNGYTGSAATADTYQSSNGGVSWSLVTASASLPARYSAGAAVVHAAGRTVAIVCGGLDSAGAAQADCWSSTAASGQPFAASWIQVNAAAPFDVRSGHSLLAVGDRALVIVAGRGAGGVASDDVWSSATLGVTWTRVCLSPFPTRDRHGAASQLTLMAQPNQHQQNRASPMPVLMVAGGVSSVSGSYLNDVHLSLDGGSSWQALPTAPWLARQGHQLVAAAGVWYVVGGQADPATFGTLTLQDAWLTVDGIKWSCLTAAATHMGQRVDFAAIAFATGGSVSPTLIVVGGSATVSPASSFFDDAWSAGPLLDPSVFVASYSFSHPPDAHATLFAEWSGAELTDGRLVQGAAAVHDGSVGWLSSVHITFQFSSAVMLSAFELGYSVQNGVSVAPIVSGLQVSMDGGLSFFSLPLSPITQMSALQGHNSLLVSLTSEPGSRARAMQARVHLRPPTGSLLPFVLDEVSFFGVPVGPLPRGFVPPAPIAPAPSGWFDVIGQGVPNDYCRFASLLDPAPQCQLAGPLGVSLSNQLVYSAGNVTRNLCFDVQCDASFSCQASTGLCTGGRSAIHVTAIPLHSYTCGSTISFITVTPPHAPTSSVTLTLQSSSPNHDLLASPSSLTFSNADPQHFNLTYPACSTVTTNATESTQAPTLSFSLVGPSAAEFIAPATRSFSSLRPSSSIYLSDVPVWIDPSEDHVLTLQVVLATSFYLLHPEAIVEITSSAGVVEPALLTFTAADDERRTSAQSITFTLSAAAATSLTGVTISARVGGNALVLSSQFLLSTSVQIVVQSAASTIPSLASTIITAGFVSAPVVVLPPSSLRAFPAFVTISVADGITPVLLHDAMPGGRLLPATSLQVRMDSASGASFRLLAPAAGPIRLLFAVESADQFGKIVPADATVMALSPCAAGSAPANGAAGTCVRPTAVNGTCSIACNVGFRIVGDPQRCEAAGPSLIGAQSCVADASVTVVSPLALPIALSSFSSVADQLGVAQVPHPMDRAANLTFAHPTTVSVLLQPTGWFMLQAIDVSYSAAADSQRPRMAGVEVSVDQINFYSLALPPTVDQLFAAVGSHIVRLTLPNTPVRAVRVYFNFAAAGNPSLVLSQLTPLGYPFVPVATPAPPVVLSGAASMCPSLLAAPGWFDAQLSGSAVDFCYLVGSSCADAFISCQLATSAHAQTPRGQFRYDFGRAQMYQDPCFYRVDECTATQRAVYLSSIPVQPFLRSVSYGLTIQAMQQTAPLSVSLLFSPSDCARVIGGNSFWLTGRLPQSFNLSNPATVGPCTVSVAAVGLAGAELPTAVVINAIPPASVLASGISPFVNAGELSSLHFTLSSPPRLPALTVTLALSAGGGTLSVTTHSWTTLMDAAAFTVNYTAPASSGTPITLSLRLTGYAAGDSALLPWLDPANPEATSALSPAGGYSFDTSYSWQVSPPCTDTPTSPALATMDAGCPASVLSGSSCAFTCLSGTAIQGWATMTCMGGSWIADGTCKAAFVLPNSLSLYRFEDASMGIAAGRAPVDNVTLVATSSDPAALLLQTPTTLRFSAADLSTWLNVTSSISGQYTLSFVVGGADAASFVQPLSIIVHVLEQANFVFSSLPVTLYSEESYTLTVHLSEPANFTGVALASNLPSLLSFAPHDASMVTAGLPLTIVAPSTLGAVLLAINFTVSGTDRAHFAVPDAILVNVLPCINFTITRPQYFYVMQSIVVPIRVSQVATTTLDIDMFSRAVTSSFTANWNGIGLTSANVFSLPMFSAVDVVTLRFRSMGPQFCTPANLTIPVLPRANITIGGLRADRTYYQNQFVDGLTIDVTEAPLLFPPAFFPNLWDSLNNYGAVPSRSMPVGQTSIPYSFTVPDKPKSDAGLIATFIATGVYTLRIRFVIPPNGESPHYAVPADFVFTILKQSYLNITDMPSSIYSLQRSHNVTLSVQQPVNVGTNLSVTIVVSPAGAVVISPASLIFTPGESALNFTVTAAMLTVPAMVSISFVLNGTDTPHYRTLSPRFLTVLPTSALMADHPPSMVVSPSLHVPSCDPFSIDIGSSVAVQYGLARSYVWSLLSITHAQGPLMGQLDSNAEGALVESVLNSSSIDSGVGLGYTFGSLSANHTLLSFPAHLLTMNRVYTFGVLIGGLPNTSLPTWFADTLFWSNASLVAIDIVPPTMPTVALTGPLTLRRNQDALYTVALTTTCSPNVFANVSFAVSDQLAPEIALFSTATSPSLTLSIARQGTLLLAGQNYTIAATMTFFDNLGNILDTAVAAWNTSITRMPLVASMLGGNQIQTIGVNLTVDASASHDPDTIGLASPPALLFNWSCLSQNATAGLTFATLPTSGYDTPCPLAMLPSSTTPVLEMPDWMTAGDTVYQFTVSVMDSGAGRTASAVQLVWVRFAALYPEPTIVLSSPTAQTRVNPQESIVIQSSVTLSPNVTTIPAALIYAWSVTILPPGSTPALSPTALALPLNSVARGWLARNGLFGLNQAQYLGHADSDFGFFVSDAVLAELEGNMTAWADWQAMVQDPSDVAFTALGGDLLLSDPALRSSSPVATAANSDPKDLALRPGLLLPGYSYRFTCHVTDPGALGIGGESDDTFYMHVNAPPSGGSCSAVVDQDETPANVALALLGLSSINVSCSGWTDEDTAMPLTYAISSTYVRAYGTLDPATALSPAGPSASRTGLSLAQNRTYHIISTVRDSEGGRHSVVTELNVPFWAPLVIPPLIANTTANVTANSTAPEPPHVLSLCELTNITQMLLLPSLYQQNYGQSIDLLMLLSTLLGQINTSAPATDLTVLCQGPPVTNTIVNGLGQLLNSSFASNTQSITLILQTINHLNFTSVDLSALELLMQQILGRLYGSALNGTNASGPGIPMTPQQNTDILQALADVVGHYMGAGDCASFNASLAITLQLADALLLGSTPLADAPSVMLITESFLVGTQRARMETGIRTELAWRPWDQNRTVSADMKAGFGLLAVSLSSAAMNGLVVAKQIADLTLTPDPKVDVVMLQFHSDWNRCRPGGLSLGSASHLILRDVDTHLPLDFAALNERVYFKQQARVEMVPSSVPTTTLAEDGVTYLQEIIPAFPMDSLTYCNFSHVSASGQINPIAEAGLTLSAAEMAFNADRCPVSCSFVNVAIGQYAAAGCSVASVLPAADGLSTHLEVTCACSHLTEFSLLYDRDISNSLVLGDAPSFETSAVYLVFLCLYILVALCTLYEIARIVKNAACEQWVLLGAHIILLVVAATRIVGQYWFRWGMQHTDPSLSTIGALMIAPQSMANVLWFLLLYLWASIRLHRVITPATAATSAAAAVSLVPNNTNAIASPSAATSSTGATAPPSPVALLVKDVDPFIPLRSLFGGLNCVGAVCALVLFVKLGLDSTEDARRLDLVLAAVVMLLISAASVVSLLVYASWLIRSLPKPIPPARAYSPWTYTQKRWGHFLALLWCAMVSLVIYSFLHVDTYVSKMHRLHAGYLSMDVAQLLVILRLLKVLVNPLWDEKEARAKRHLSTRKQVQPPMQQKPEWRLGSTRNLLEHTGSSSSQLTANNEAADAYAALQRKGSQFTASGLLSPSSGSPPAASGVARAVPSCDSILLVGADPELADRLLEAGFRIADIARDGATALDMVGVKRYDAVLVLDAPDLGMQSTFIAQSIREIEQSKGRAPCHAMAVSGVIDSLTQQMMEVASLNGCIESGQYLPDAVLEALKQLSADPSKFVVIRKEHSAEPSRTSPDDAKSHWKFIKMAQQKQAEREAGKAAAASEAADKAATTAAAESAEGVVTPAPAKTAEGETEEDEQARAQNHRWLISAWFNDTQAPAQALRHQRFVPGQTGVGASSLQSSANGCALPGDAPAHRPPAPTAAASRRSAPPSGSNTPGARLATPDADCDSDVQWSPNPVYNHPDEVGDELAGGGASGYATPRAGARSASACNTPGSKSISTNDVVVLKSGTITPVIHTQARSHIRSPSGVAPEASGPPPAPSAPSPKPQSRRATGAPLSSKAPPASQRNLFSNSPFSEQFVPAKNAPGTVARRSSSDKKKVKQPAATANQAVTAGNTPSRVPASIASRPLDLAAMTPDRASGPVSGRGSARLGPASPAKRVLDFTVEQVPSARSIHFNPNPASTVDGGLSTNRDVQDDPELLRALRMDVPAQDRVDDGTFAAPAELIDSATGLPLDLVAAAAAAQPASAAPLAPTSMRVTEVQPGSGSASSSSSAILVSAKASPAQSSLFAAFTPSAPPAPYVSSSSSVFAPNAEVTGVASFAPPPARIVTSGLVVAPNPPPGIAAAKIPTPRHHPSPSMPLTTFTLPPSALRCSPPAVSPAVSPPLRASPSNSRATSSIPSGAAGDSISYQNRLNGMSLDDSGNLHAGLAALTSPDVVSDLCAMPSSGALSRAGLIKAPSRGAIGLVDPQLIVPTRPKADSPVITRPRPLRTISSGGDGLLTRGAPASPSSATLAAASVRTPMGAGAGPGTAATFAPSAVSRSSPRPRGSPPPGITKPAAGAKPAH